MHKNRFLFSTLILLLYPFTINGMKRGCDVVQEEEYERLIALDSGTAPDRYGVLEKSKPNHTDASSLIVRLDQPNLESPIRYPTTRTRIANALRCGYYHRDFARIATEKNDSHLWQLLLVYQQPIQHFYGIDVASTPWAFGEKPPLFGARSVEIASLLVQRGQASIVQQKDSRGETVIHRACYHDRSPALLRYYLAQTPQGVNIPDRYNSTPLLTLCDKGFGGAYRKAEYLENALEKLAILTNAQANFFQKNTANKSALDIVRERMQGIHKDNIPSLQIFLASITSAINKQRDARIAAMHNEECTICMAPLENDVKMLDCFHFFHENCILQSMHAGIVTCPTCRADIELPDHALDSDSDEDNDDFDVAAVNDNH